MSHHTREPTSASGAVVTASSNTTTSHQPTKTNPPDNRFLCMGDGIHTFQISFRDLFVANRQKVLERIVESYLKKQQQQHQRDSGGDACSTAPPVSSSGTDIVIYIMGGTTQLRYDSDHEPIFRQESYFFYLTGIQEPDCAMSIHIHIEPPTLLSNSVGTTIKSNEDDVDDDNTKTSNVTNLHSRYSFTSATRLYIPNLPAEYATVMGPIRTKLEWKEMYFVDSVEYMTMTDDDDNHNDRNCSSSNVVETFILSDLLYHTDSDDNRKSDKILMVMNGVNSDSGNEYPKPTTLNYSLFLNVVNDGVASITIDTTTLYPILAECRVIKSDTELYLLRYATEVTSFGHAYVMRNFQTNRTNEPNNTNNSTKMYEYQGESLFRHYCYYNYGCRLVGYTPICGCGPNSAILHYGHSGRPNSDPTTPENTICLFDMGIEYFQYGSDVTCSFPSNGTFTTNQRRIYEGVLKAQIVVYNMMRPGVSWVACHKAAEATILTALVDIGIVILSPSSRNDMVGAAPAKTIAELVEMRLGAVFMPHGLGHFIGLDTHDVGGYLEGHPPRIAQPGLCKLRTARILQTNMVLTVEPGCYFIHHLLDEVMTENHVLRPYINKDLINDEYRNFGGIRLEDVVQVTTDGMINYTLCPRTITEVEQVCTRQMQWPPLHDMAPELRRVRLLDTKPLPPPPSL